MASIEEKANQFKEAAAILDKVKEEIRSFIVGQEDVIDQVLWSIIAGGHVLLEGLPGMGKTMLVKTISESMDLKFSRIQFTPDLMPSDITGTMLLQPDGSGKQAFVFHEGPLFGNIILADEINRATPKTQSSLLEAMGEKTVTIMGETKMMDRPFFVLATQNPIDMEGTYPLPEAQLDRFMCKIQVSYPTKEELKEIVLRTTGTRTASVQKAAAKKDVLEIQALAKEILVSEEMIDAAVSIISATHPESPDATGMVRQYIQFGSGPRGLQSLIMMAKARAMSQGRYHVSMGDLRKAALPVLRHRLIVNFEADSSGISADEIIRDLVESRNPARDGRQHA